MSWWLIRIELPQQKRPNMMKRDLQKRYDTYPVATRYVNPLRVQHDDWPNPLQSESACASVTRATHCCKYSTSGDMGWLRLVGSLNLQVSFAEYRFFYRALLQKRPIILRSLLNSTSRDMGIKGVYANRCSYVYVYIYIYIYMTCIDLHIYFLRHVLVWNKSKMVWEESLCSNRNPHKLSIHTPGVFQERFGKTVAAQQVGLDRCRKKYY